MGAPLLIINHTREQYFFDGCSVINYPETFLPYYVNLFLTKQWFTTDNIEFINVHPSIYNEHYDEDGNEELGHEYVDLEGDYELLDYNEPLDTSENKDDDGDGYLDENGDYLY